MRDTRFAMTTFRSGWLVGGKRVALATIGALAFGMGSALAQGAAAPVVPAETVGTGPGQYNGHLMHENGVTTRERVLSSPSAHDVGTNSNYPLDKKHSSPVMSSPSAHDVGTNSNYPLDKKHEVAIDNRGVKIPNNNSEVQSPNSKPGPIGEPSKTAVTR